MTQRSRARLAELAALLQVDRSVLSFALGRLWPVLAGPVTALAITGFMTASEQGFYYTFGSLLAMSTFFELSFSIALIPFVAHEWAQLTLGASGKVEGDAESLKRLAGLGRFALIWYTGISSLFVVVVAIVGARFLASEASFGVDWGSPWAVLVVLSGIHLFMVAPTAILEGCHRVEAVYFTRFLGFAGGSLGVWAVLALGGGVWAACAAIGAAVMAELILIVRYRRFFVSILATRGVNRIAWRTEVWPMQWRMAGSGVFSYFAFNLFVPVVFHYHGAEAAGRMGMTWQLTSAVGGLAQAWLNPRVPRFATLIAQRDYSSLDRLFYRVSAVSMAVASSAGITLVVLVVGLNWMHAPLAERILAPQWVAVLLVAVVLMQGTQCASAYLRAHRREPLMPISIASSLAIGALVWLLGARYGAPGAVVAYLVVTGVVVVPSVALIWRHSRRVWHADADVLGALHD